MVGTYLLYFSGCLIGTVGGIAVKQYGKKTADIRNATNSFNLIFAVISLVYFAVTGFIGSGGLTINYPTLGYALFRSVGEVIGMFGYLQAVRYGSLLLSIVISRMGMLLPVVYSLIFYEDTLTVCMTIGAVLLVAALVLFNKYGEDDRRTSPRFWVYVSLSFTGNGITMIAMKVQQKELHGLYKSEFLFFSMIIVTLVFLVMFLLRPPVREGRVASGGVPAKADEKTPKERLRAFSSVFFAGFFWLFLYAITNASSNFISTTVINDLPVVFFYFASTGIGIFLSFIVARFLFRERLSLLQYLGCVMAAAGLILLNF